MNPNAHTPPWLEDEPELRDLLHAVLDRFNKQPASLYPAGIKSPQPQTGADRLWHFVQQLTNHNLCTIVLGKPSPYDPDWKGAHLAFPPEAETTLRQWLQRPNKTPAIQA
jgi:hypothetical protein